MNEKIQLICLGFCLGLTVFAATPAESTVEPVVKQRQSIFDVEPTVNESLTVQPEREEVIESDSGDSETESSESKSLPLDPQQVKPATPSTNAVQLVLPAAFSMNGKQYDLDSFVTSYYRRPWTYPGGIDAHLASHGVDSWSIQGLSHSEKERLHAAIHEQELQMGTIAPKTQTGTIAPKTQTVTRSYQSNCPDDVCPSPQWQTTTRQRRGLFGLRR